MPAEPVVPVAILETLWRRFRQMERSEFAERERHGGRAIRGQFECAGLAWRAAARDLRAIINERRERPDDPRNEG